MTLEEMWQDFFNKHNLLIGAIDIYIDKYMNIVDACEKIDFIEQSIKSYDVIHENNMTAIRKMQVNHLKRDLRIRKRKIQDFLLGV